MSSQVTWRRARAVGVMQGGQRAAQSVVSAMVTLEHQLAIDTLLATVRGMCTSGEQHLVDQSVVSGATQRRGRQVLGQQVLLLIIHRHQGQSSRRHGAVAVLATSVWSSGLKVARSTLAT